MTGQSLVPSNRESARSLRQIVSGRSGKRAERDLAQLKSHLESVLAREPNDYQALTVLGELDLRVGLVMEAQALLYRASLLPPPSWEAYQRTSLLLRRAEASSQHSFDRPAGAPPPRVLRRLAAAASRAVARLVALFSRDLPREVVR